MMACSTGEANTPAPRTDPQPPDKSTLSDVTFPTSPSLSLWGFHWYQENENKNPTFTLLLQPRNYNRPNVDRERRKHQR
jgi:hypothetical protein